MYTTKNVDLKRMGPLLSDGNSEVTPEFQNFRGIFL